LKANPSIRHQAGRTALTCRLPSCAGPGPALPAHGDTPPG
jgi:hypothetical protein